MTRYLWGMRRREGRGGFKKEKKKKRKEKENNRKEKRKEKKPSTRRKTTRKKNRMCLRPQSQPFLCPLFPNIIQQRPHHPPLFPFQSLFCHFLLFFSFLFFSFLFFSFLFFSSLSSSPWIEESVGFQFAKITSCFQFDKINSKSL